jgi:D-apionolactonase
MSSREFLLYGTRQSEPQARRLSAGPISAEFINGNLRTICFYGVEVLQAISFLVRDKDCGTHAPRPCNLQISEGVGNFEVRFDACCNGPVTPR